MRYKYGTIHFYYDPEKNKLRFPGTDELKDFKLSIQCWKEKGFHAGCYKWVKDNLWEILGIINHDNPVYIEGHSLGGGIAQVLAILLTQLQYIVTLELDGAFPAVEKGYERILRGNADIYGNDPVPSLFPWFHYPVRTNYKGPERRFIKVLLQWFILSQSDHMKYWG